MLWGIWAFVGFGELGFFDIRVRELGLEDRKFDLVRNELQFWECDLDWGYSFLLYTGID